MKTCAACGARSADDATWCSQCFVAFDAEPGLPPEPPDPVAPEPMVDPFSHPEVMRDPVVAHYSRWAKSEITMGPFGRVATSLLMLVPLWFFFSSGLLGFVGMVMWIFVVMPVALRSIWKRARVIDEAGTSQLDP